MLFRSAPLTEHVLQRVRQIAQVGTVGLMDVRAHVVHVTVGKCVRVVSALKFVPRTAFRMEVSAVMMVVGEHVVTVGDSSPVLMVIVWIYHPKMCQVVKRMMTFLLLLHSQTLLGVGE